MRADGSVFPAEVAVTRVPVDGPPLFTGYIRDITERKQMEEALRHQALHDALTGLPNRTLLHDRCGNGQAVVPRVDQQPCVDQFARPELVRRVGKIRLELD